MSAIKIPFQFTNGKLEVTNSPDVMARQKIIDVLTTERFERVMRHTYGVGIRSLLFENIDDLAFSDIKVDAMHTISETISRVDVLDLVISEVPPSNYYGSDETTVAINVVYKLPLGSPRVLSYNVAVPGALNEETPI